jgi:hypothetical protein
MIMFDPDHKLDGTSINNPEACIDFRPYPQPWPGDGGPPLVGPLVGTKVSLMVIEAAYGSQMKSILWWKWPGRAGCTRERDAVPRGECFTYSHCDHGVRPTCTGAVKSLDRAVSR